MKMLREIRRSPIIVPIDGKREHLPLMVFGALVGNKCTLINGCLFPEFLVVVVGYADHGRSVSYT